MKKPFVAIIDGGGANFTSIKAALNRLDCESTVTSEVDVIQRASHLILPGVGAAGYAMNTLRQQGLVDVIRQRRQPVLGICLGQQLMCAYSDEQSTDCLEIFPLKVRFLNGQRIIPHMGWNNLTVINKTCPLLNGITTEMDFYFAHSYAPEVSKIHTVGFCGDDSPFSAVIQHNNFYGVQFHPEKSGRAGQELLFNFIKLGA